MNRPLLLSVVVPCLLAAVLTSAQAQGPMGAAHQRPFSEWVAAQGTILRPDGRPLVYSWTDNPPAMSMLVDYTGKLGAWVSAHGGPAIDTELQGTVMERELDDGTAELVANVHFKNALVFAQPVGGAIALGYSALQLAANGSLQPGLATGVMQLKFRLPYAGAPIPDIILVDQFEALSIRATGFGPMRAASGVPEGTPGMCLLSQTGLFNFPGRGATDDGYPAEICRVQVLGGAAVVASSAHSAAAPTAAPARPRSTWGWIKSLYR